VKIRSRNLEPDGIKVSGNISAVGT